MEHKEYFSNLDQIEKSWKELKQNKFPQNMRDDFWRLCTRGRELFWLMRNDDIKEGYKMVKSVPSYERAVALLEYEKKYTQAIKMCKEANSLGISTTWYLKKINQLEKKTK